MAEPGKKVFMGLSKNQAIFVAIGGAGVVYVVYRHYKNAAAVVNDTSSTTGTDASASDIDPATGYQYGSVEDDSALAEQSGTAAGDEYGTSGTLTTNPYYSASPTALQPTTNASWSQYAQQQLSNIGYDPETVAGAIGAYLAQIALTPTQAGIVQVALAECGPPPQGSYSILTQGTSTATTTGTGTTSTTTSTSTGTPATPSGLTGKATSNTSISASCNSVSGATGYEWRVTYQTALVQQTQTSGPSVTLSGLTPDHTYGIHAIATNSAGWSSEASITVQTPK